MNDIVEITEARSEATFNEWRAEEVARAGGDTNVSLTSCHGFAEMANKAGDKIRLAAFDAANQNILGICTGVVVVSRRQKRLELAQLYVKFDARGGGIAQALVEAVKNVAVIQFGATNVALGVGLQEQLPTLGFWQRFGFDRVHENKPAITAVPMHIELMFWHA